MNLINQLKEVWKGHFKLRYKLLSTLRAILHPRLCSYCYMYTAWGKLLCKQCKQIHCKKNCDRR